MSSTNSNFEIKGSVEVGVGVGVGTAFKVHSDPPVPLIMHVQPESIMFEVQPSLLTKFASSHCSAPTATRPSLGIMQQSAEQVAFGIPVGLRLYPYMQAEQSAAQHWLEQSVVSQTLLKLMIPSPQVFSHSNVAFKVQPELQVLQTIPTAKLATLYVHNQQLASAQVQNVTTNGVEIDSPPRDITTLLE